MSGVAQINIPGLKGPSGSVYNDIVLLITAVVALLKAFGVIG